MGGTVIDADLEQCGFQENSEALKIFHIFTENQELLDQELLVFSQGISVFEAAKEKKREKLSM